MLTTEQRFAALHDIGFWKSQIDVSPSVRSAAWDWNEDLDGPTATELRGGDASDTGAPVTDPATRAEDDAFLSEVLSEVTERSLTAPALGPTDDGGWDAELSGAGEGGRDESEGTRQRVARIVGTVSGLARSVGPEVLTEARALARAALAEARAEALREAAA